MFLTPIEFKTGGWLKNWTTNQATSAAVAVPPRVTVKVVELVKLWVKETSSNLAVLKPEPPLTLTSEALRPVLTADKVAVPEVATEPTAMLPDCTLEPSFRLMTSQAISTK